uniref:Glucosidase II subunit alpha n=1 Tax=Pristhesancus plagipennis TaxID=1955184 RepID=A0A2K8JWU1_PRIPG|nr:secreted Glucosidase-like protein [Pristhesancus plagipennis]
MIVKLRFHILYLLLVVVHDVFSVDRNNFKTCEQSSFCRRCRKMEAGKSAYELDLSTLQTSDNDLKVEMIDTDSNVRFILKISPIVDNIVRLQVEEASPLRQRFVSPHVLVKEPALNKWSVTQKTEKLVIIEVKNDNYRIELHSVPFRIDVFYGDELVTSGNAKGLFKFEHTRTKPEQMDPNEDPGTWEENFKSHHDNKPHGPTAVAMDFIFPDAKYAYGLPEHADSLALKSTTKGEPYRFYNLDVFEYEVDSPMAIYAAIPVLFAHSEERTTGLFWLNPTETWVDITVGNENVVSSVLNFVSGGGNRPQVDAHFMSEGGNIDVFILLGPRPSQAFIQYTKLTGTAPIPPLFSLAYHQSRWNYNDQQDVDAVNKGFDEYDIPMDAMWLDIEHTDNKKYFTWDPFKFSDPVEMQQNLTARGRKLVVIVDPHIKRDPGYFLHNDATNNGFYVKNKDNADYEGWCWPGSSSYLDLLDPKVRDYYASRYKFTNYIGSTEALHIWNDMNEPSVFNGPEITMPKDNIHFGGWEHREVHNLWGLLHVMSTYDGLIKRDNAPYEESQRPFILTRSAFAGSQRYTAIWTGDNAAEWSHLRVSIPMCLSLAIAGMSFCGADVGGFFKNPDRELFTRWYQTGAYLPFFRSHSHIDTKRREPWIFDSETTGAIREAIRARYSYLPFWYTQFYFYNATGMPVIQPLWAEFPEEEDTFSIENEFLVGNSLLVRPVTESGVSQVSVHFPGKDDIWFDTDTNEMYHHGQSNIPVTYTKIPVYQRGGSIIPRKMRVRRSSALMQNDPITLIVALDSKGKASGHLYIDDGTTHKYLHSTDSSVLIHYNYNDNSLKSEIVGAKHFETSSWLERVIILGMKPGTYKATAFSKNIETSLATNYDNEKKILTIRKPALPIAEEWHIKLH